jgi:Bacterial Ig-like domain
LKRVQLVFAVVVAIALTLGSLGVASAQETTAQDGLSAAAKRFVLTDIKPNNGDTGVSSSTVVRATFNRTLDASSVRRNFTLTDLSTGKEVSATVDVNGETARLKPKSDLKRGDRYEAILASGVRSKSGDRLDSVDGSGADFNGGEATWRFRVS